MDFRDIQHGFVGNAMVFVPQLVPNVNNAIVTLCWS
jgi:hypothetical protein